MPKNVKWDSLKVLDQIGCCYKEDYYLLLGTKPTPLYNQFLKDGLIEEREIRRQGALRTSNQTTTIVKITQKGINVASEHSNDPIYLRTKFRNKNIFDYESLNQLWPHLTSQKIKIMYEAAGVATFPCDKPSLEYLFRNLNRGGGEYEEVVYKTYLDSSLEDLDPVDKQKELMQILEDGIYYDKQEFFRAANYVESKKSDTFKGIKWEGLFVSNKTCLLTFVSSYGKNKRIKLPYSQLQNLLTAVSRIFCDSKITEVKRSIGCISESTEQKNWYRHSINALLVGIGESLVYTTATCYTGGIRKNVIGKDYKELQRAKLDAVTRDPKKLNSTHEFLDVTSRNFKSIFVVQDSNYGVDKLYYLTHNTIEDWHSQMISLFENDKRFELNGSVAMSQTPGIYKTKKSIAVYMPVHEIFYYDKVFSQIKNNYDSITFITDEKMADTISHCCRMGSKIYFFTTDYDKDDKLFIDKLLDYKKYYYYDEYGYVGGIKQFMDLAYENGYKLANNKEIYNLPKVFGVGKEGYREFFNDIYTGKINKEKLWESLHTGNSNKKESFLIDLEEIEQPKPVRDNTKEKVDKNHKMISILLDEAHYQQLKVVMKKNGMKSKARFAKSVLIPVIEQKYGEINLENIKKKR